MDLFNMTTLLGLNISSTGPPSQTPSPPLTTTTTTAVTNFTLMTSSCDDCSNNTVTTTMDGVTGAKFYPWDNPYNVMSRETLRLVEKLVNCGFNWLLLLLGVPGNIVSCLVFYRQGLGDRMNVSLFALGLTDLFCVITWFMMGSSCHVSAAPASLPLMTRWTWTVRKYVRGLHRAFLASSGCVTLVIAVERCVCVLVPLRAASLVSVKAMVGVIAGVVVSLQLLHLVYPLQFDVVPVYDEALNMTVYTTRGTQLFKNYRTFFNALESTVLLTVVPVITFTVIVIATVITVARLQRTMTWRRGVSTENVKMKTAQLTLIRMLVTVSCVYIATTTPKIVLGIVRNVVPEFARTGHYSNVFQATHLISLALGTLNSSINIFVYCSQSSRFRQQLGALLPRVNMCKRLLGRPLVTRVNSGPTTSMATQTNWEMTSSAPHASNLTLSTAAATSDRELSSSVARTSNAKLSSGAVHASNPSITATTAAAIAIAIATTTTTTTIDTIDKVKVTISDTEINDANANTNVGNTADTDATNTMNANAQTDINTDETTNTNTNTKPDDNTDATTNANANANADTKTDSNTDATINIHANTKTKTTGITPTNTNTHANITTINSNGINEIKEINGEIDEINDTDPNTNTKHHQ